MAHQAHHICWDALASNLEYYSPPVINGNRDCMNLHYKRKPQQAKELGYFVEPFVRSLENCTECKRRNYPDFYEPPNDDDIIIEDDVVKKIKPTVFRWRMDRSWSLANLTRTARTEALCQHDNGFNCGCPIPMEERKASSFFREDAFRGSCNCFMQDSLINANRAKFFNIELVKTLLLYGEMDTILRVCSQPNCDYAPWQVRKQGCTMEPDVGWDRLYFYALDAYICLNVLYLFPELWDPAMMKGPEGEGLDYRCTAMYQRMVHYCTQCHTISQIAKYPHRQFFGIRDDQFSSNSTAKGAGQLAFQDFVRGNAPETPLPPSFMPNIFDIYNVREMLRIKGLPTELIWQVLELTEYDAPKHRLKVAQHPFHPDNREELQKYLKYCWQILIRCNMMAKELQLELEIDWRALVVRCLRVYFSSPGGENVVIF